MIPVYQDQDKILKEVSTMAFFPFVLSGGTGLSRFYLYHRVSEDLDFYFTGFEFDFPAVEKVINALRSKNLKCRQIGTTDKPGLLRAVSYVCVMDQEIKLDFLEDPFSGMWDSARKQIAEGGTILKVSDSEDVIYGRLKEIASEIFEEGLKSWDT
ncbi:MAG: nucleotidyl transferase AbiEii/AbiGii toxin family protein [bacterium]